MSAILTRSITLEEFEALPYSETERMEVIDGEMVESMPPGYEHGQIVTRLWRFLDRWAEQNGEFELVPESGYILREYPLVLLSPDLSMTRLSEVKQRTGLEKPWRGAPVLAVEVISPNQRAYDVSEKVDRYLEFGTELVLTIWPIQKKIDAHLPDGDAHTFRLGDRLEMPDILPGFSCLVEALFP